MMLIDAPVITGLGLDNRHQAVLTGKPVAG